MATDRLLFAVSLSDKGAQRQTFFLHILERKINGIDTAVREKKSMFDGANMSPSLLTQTGCFNQ